MMLFLALRYVNIPNYFFFLILLDFLLLSLEVINILDYLTILNIEITNIIILLKSQKKY